MKKVLIAIFALLLFATAANAKGLAIEYPSDYDIITGYTFVFNETGETDNPYTKSVSKSDLEIDTAENQLVYWDFEENLNLQVGQTYDIKLFAWNADVASGYSETVSIEGPAAYTPPDDNLPEGNVIVINPPVTIVIRDR